MDPPDLVVCRKGQLYKSIILAMINEDVLETEEISPLDQFIQMTRTNKWDGESHHDSHYFTHNHPFNQAPNNVKKQGAGKSNWGAVGSEIDDLVDDDSIPPVFNKERRGSNHSQHEEKFKYLQKESIDRLGEEEDVDDE